MKYKRSSLSFLTVGRIEAHDPSGPPLAGGPPNSVRAYKTLKNLSELVNGTMVWSAWILRQTKFEGTRVTLQGDWLLNSNQSSFPAPPNRQIQVYEGTLLLSWNSVLARNWSWFSFTWRDNVIGANGSTTMTGRISLNYLPVSQAVINGTGEGVMQPHALLPNAPLSVRFSFNSENPINPGAPSSIFNIRNFWLTFTW